MSLPEVVISVKNGNLGGGAELADGVAGIIVSGDTAPDAENFKIGEAKQFFSIGEVKDAGLDAQYDIDNATNAFKQVADFFTVAGDGAEIWVMVIAKTETLEDICDIASGNAYANTMLEAADGRIRLLAVSRITDAAYVPSYAAGIDDDVVAALGKLNALAVAKAGDMEPFIGIVDGRDYQGDSGTLEDLTGLGFNRVVGVIAGDVETGSAGVGLLLGRLAADPVQRKPGRVKTGAIPIANAYFTDGTKVTRALAEVLDAKGWVVMTPYPQRSGVYWGVDHTCSSADDDFSTIVNRRVIDKAVLIAYSTYVTEIMDEVEVDDDGKLQPGVVKYFEGKILNAINNGMTANSEISSVTAFVDPKQNILSTEKLVVALEIVPVGYTKTIQVNLGFSNPAL
ncbi:DUF2586 family protein [uncultured Draconibacterium sp.]|uniref:DUF2586 family protein n=1 Tax=uncultured Draconibacterium sp. TaxID=1573823 RepID=UPI0025D73783|nr:DUF2586 family protein [uncultured Draconibacterium sp.]